MPPLLTPHPSRCWTEAETSGGRPKRCRYARSGACVERFDQMAPCRSAVVVTTNEREKLPTRLSYACGLHCSAQPDVKPATADVRHALASQDFVRAQDGLFKLSVARAYLEEINAYAPIEPLPLVTHALDELARCTLVHQTSSYAPGRSVRAWQYDWLHPALSRSSVRTEGTEVESGGLDFGHTSPSTTRNDPGSSRPLGRPSVECGGWRRSSLR